MLFSSVILVSFIAVCFARLGQKQPNVDIMGAPYPYGYGSTPTNFTVVTPDSAQFCTCTCYNAASPTATPTASPSANPSANPSAVPSFSPTAIPSASPSAGPTATPSARPSAGPTLSPSAVPTAGAGSITFYGANSATKTTPSGYNLWKFGTAGSYNFTMNNFLGKTISVVIVGGGSGGQSGATCCGTLANFYGGTGGSGGQALLLTYTVTSNSLACTAVVGKGGMPYFRGNGGVGTNPVSSSYDTSGTLYGSTNTNDATCSGVCSSGGFSQFVCPGAFGTVKVLGGTAATSANAAASTCSNTGYQTGTGTTSPAFYQGKPGGLGVANTTPNNGQTGSSISVAGSAIVFGSSAGGSQLDQTGQSTSGTNAGASCGSGPGTKNCYNAWTNPSGYDGFPGVANTGAGGGGASGSGGWPYQTANVNYDRQAGGYGGSGVLYIWY